MSEITTIALSESEKDRLDEIAAVAFEDRDPENVPYDETLSMLIDTFKGS